jgi:hypothetical protein
MTTACIHPVLVPFPAIAAGFDIETVAILMEMSIRMGVQIPIILSKSHISKVMATAVI